MSHWNQHRIWNWVPQGQKLGQILKKTNFGHNFFMISIKIAQGVYYNETSGKFETGSYGIKNLITKSNLTLKNTTVRINGKDLTYVHLLMYFEENKILIEAIKQHNYFPSRSYLLASK